MRKLLVVGLMLFTGHTYAAMAVFEDGPDNPSMHGADGTLVVNQGADDFTLYVEWALNVDGFIGTSDPSNHPYLTDAGFKVSGTDVASASLLGIATSDSSTPSGAVLLSNVNNDGCSGSDPSGFVCVDLAAPGWLATEGGWITIAFQVQLATAFNIEANIDTTEFSFAGKFGPENGWVISESSAAVPEPGTIALVGLSLAGLGALRRRKNA